AVGRMCTVPEPFPKEFRDDVVNVARGRELGQTIEQIAADFGMRSHVCATGCAQPMSRTAHARHDRGRERRGA
ncbi:MAG TPA: hypothetical protein VFY90_04490, partial [Tepidiformaceae bacterium]|nr:hypothetical protein [Tepidiformaceae bacterium]